MENFFIPSRKINEVKQKKKSKEMEKFFAMVFIKTFLLHFSVAKDAQNQPKNEKH